MPDPEENAGDGDGAGDGQGAGDGAEKNKVVPQEQFDKVYGQMKTLERQIEELQKGGKDGALSAEQKKELEAKTYLKNLLKETLDETDKERSARETADLATFQKEVDDVLTVNTDIKKDDFLNFLEEEGDDFSSVAAAMRGFKRQGEIAEDASDKTKRNERKKPDMPKSDGDGRDTTDYTEKDKGKSIWQVAQDAIKEFSSKGKK